MHYLTVSTEQGETYMCSLKGFLTQLVYQIKVGRVR